MKKYLLVFLIFISSTCFSQIKVKENSFRLLEDYVMIDKYEHVDMNDAPMALIKISTENITAEQRRKFSFKGNAITYFDVHFNPGEIFLYISADAATFIEIIHDDYGKTEYWFPFDLKGFCGYEMILQYIPIGSAKSHNNYITITTKPENADIYIDDNYMGQTPKVILDLQEGNHEIKLIKKGYRSFVKMIDIKINETIIIDELLQSVKEVTIETDKNDDNLYINGNYKDKSPIVTELVDGMFGDNLTINVDGIAFDMIFVKGGHFMMGNDGYDSEDNEKPAHKVVLSDYYISETEVTQKLWNAVMGYNPSLVKDDNNPVENVSWKECQEFINKLNAYTGVQFRLPTEAEWEFAARGGNVSNDYKYSGSNKIKDVACYYNNSKDGANNVKSKQPNELQIYDMSGNVWEWCYDIYDLYEEETQVNPIGAKKGSYRVIRGGCFYDGTRHCRVSNRNYAEQNAKNAYCGFRLAVSF